MDKLVKNYLIKLISWEDEIVKIIPTKHYPNEEEIVEILLKYKDIACYFEISEGYRLHSDILHQS